MKTAKVILVWLSENYILILSMGAIGFGLFLKVKAFAAKSAEEQKAILKEQAVKLVAAAKEGLMELIVKAEIKWGDKTGTIKKSEVFNALLEKIPKLADYIEQGIIDKDVLGELIDTAVDEFNKLRESNKRIDEVIVENRSTVETTVEKSTEVEEKTDGNTSTSESIH